MCTIYVSKLMLEYTTEICVMRAHLAQKLVGEGLRLQFVRDIDLDVCN